jgi:hypothetical protein
MYEGRYQESRPRDNANTIASWEVRSHALLEFFVPRELRQQTVFIVGNLDGDSRNYLTVANQLRGVNNTVTPFG